MTSIGRDANFISESAISQDITIVIASYGRNQQLENLVNYYLDFGFYVQVAYHSDQELLLIHPRLELARINQSYAARCGYLSQKITTNFAILVTDDDIFLGERIIELCRELQTSNDSSIFGQVLGSWFNGGDFQVSPAYLPFEFYVNDSEDVTTRVLYQFSSTNLTPISMYRLTSGKILSQLLEFFSKLSFVSTPYIYEISAEIVLNVFGSSHRISKLYWIRNWDEDSISNHGWDRMVTFLDWFHMDVYEVERIKWLSLIAEYCPKLNIEALERQFHLSWERENEARKASLAKIWKAKHFFRKVSDFLRHHYSSDFKPEFLHRKVRWGQDLDLIQKALQIMYAYQVPVNQGTE